MRIPSAVRIIPAVLAVAAAGCSLLPAAGAVPYPDGCEGFGFSARRCAAIVAKARESLTTEPAQIELLEPEQDSATPGGNQVARVAFTLADGSRVVTPVTCVGVPDGPQDSVCQEPRLATLSRVDHDVPCAGEPPDGCPSQIVPSEAAVAASKPLEIAALDVPIDGVGHHEVKVGDLTLPNGYVTRVEARVVNDQPDNFWIADGIVLDLRPDAGRPPFGNVYERPLVEGVEHAELWLVFDVTEASPGAVLHLADVVAR
jgi:hypothetical protein